MVLVLFVSGCQNMALPQMHGTLHVGTGPEAPKDATRSAQSKAP